MQHLLEVRACTVSCSERSAPGTLWDRVRNWMFRTYCSDYVSFHRGGVGGNNIARMGTCVSRCSAPLCTRRRERKRPPRNTKLKKRNLMNWVKLMRRWKDSILLSKRGFNINCLLLRFSSLILIFVGGATLRSLRAINGTLNEMLQVRSNQLCKFRCYILFFSVFPVCHVHNSFATPSWCWIPLRSFFLCCCFHTIYSHTLAQAPRPLCNALESLRNK